jgi:DNA transformation protein
LRLPKGSGRFHARCLSPASVQLPTCKTPGGAPTRRPGWLGLGPRSNQWLAAIGITTPEQLAAQDPFAVYARLKANQPGVGLNLLHALIGAVENRDWRDVAREDRTSILLRLEDMGLFLDDLP